MDQAFLTDRTNHKPWWILLLIVILLILGGGGYLWFKSRAKIISPVPPNANFEVIFYTPTPGETTPTSTPSATPKIKKSPTLAPTSVKVASPSPSIKVSVTPTKEVTPTNKVSPTISPTPAKPSSTPTPTPK